LPVHLIWLVYHGNLKDVDRIRVVLNFLVALF